MKFEDTDKQYVVCGGSNRVEFDSYEEAIAYAMGIVYDFHQASRAVVYKRVSSKNFVEIAEV